MLITKTFYNGQPYGKSWPNLHGKVVGISDAGYCNGHVWLCPESERHMSYIKLDDVEIVSDR